MPAVSETPASQSLMPQVDPSTLGADHERDGVALLESCVAIQIVDVRGVEQAVQSRTRIAERLKAIDDFFDPVVSMAFKLHRALTGRKNAVRGPWERADGLYRTALQTFKAEQDRVRREEEHRLAEVARRDAQARAAEEAAALEDQGQPELAAAVVEEAIAAPPPIIVLPDITKDAGAKFRTEWKWRYVNSDKARAEQHLIPREYLCADEKKIGGYVRAMKQSAKIPGIEVYSEQVPVR